MMNLFESIGDASQKELFETLLENKKVKIERITTIGQTTPEGQWYDQEEDEFVLVLEGSARVDYEDESTRLEKGDYLYIPAHKKHRVSWSDPDRVTLWLAIFIKP